MTTPRRCLICGSLNEPYANRCGCGASLDVTADESRRVVSRAAQLAAAWAVLWAIVTLVLVGVSITLVTSPAGVQAVWWTFGTIIGAGCAFGASVRALARLVRARSNLSAIPDLPRASMRRRA